MSSARIFKQSMGARNRVGRGLSYRLARLHVLADMSNWNRCLGSIKVLKFGLYFLEVDTLDNLLIHTCDMFPLDCVLLLIFNRVSWPFLSRYLYLWSFGCTNLSNLHPFLSPWPEAEFWDVIGTKFSKFLRVFILAIHRHLYKKISLPLPLEQKWLETGL